MKIIYKEGAENIYDRPAYAETSDRCSIEKANFFFAFLDLALSSFVFAICVCLLWYSPKNRWVSFYRDWTFEYVTNFEISYEREYTEFAEAVLHVSTVATAIRMLTLHLLIGGVVLDKIHLLAPFSVWNAGTIVFSGCLLTSLIFINDSRTLTSREFEDHNARFLLASAILLAHQFGFEVYAIKQAGGIYHKRRGLITFDNDQL